MTLKRLLTTIASIVAEEAAKNPEFNSQLLAALSLNGKPPLKRSTSSQPSSLLQQEFPLAEAKRRGGRRSAAFLDPVALVESGEEELRRQLGLLDLEKLYDIVAQYGMDPGKLVMKWKDRDRVIGRIVEVAVARATKGDAFRRD